MKKHLVLLSLFSFLGCQNNKIVSLHERITYTPTLYEPKREVIGIDETTGKERFTTRLVSYRQDVNHNKIVAIRIKENQLSYTVQGWYPSSGLSVSKMSLSKEKSIDNDTLILTHQIHITKQAGKESAMVYGYNFRQANKAQIKSSYTAIIIRLTDTNGVLIDEQVIRL